MGKLTMLYNSIQITPLKRIHHVDGDIFHCLKKNDPNFIDFGEAYFTTIHQNKIKGWKKHREMVMNLIVPTGNVTFYLYDESIKSTKFISLGVDNYLRLTVPAGIWMAFKGNALGINLILNIASILHDPLESDSLPLDSLPLTGVSFENITDRF